MAETLLKPAEHIGDIFYGVTLETCVDSGKTRPRVRPIDFFESGIRVEFPRALRETFPIGTRYTATVKVCQKHNSDGSKRGAPYLNSSDVSLIPGSVPDSGLLAKVKAGSISGLAYEYKYKFQTESAQDK